MLVLSGAKFTTALKFFGHVLREFYRECMPIKRNALVSWIDRELGRQRRSNRFNYWPAPVLGSAAMSRLKTCSVAEVRLVRAVTARKRDRVVFLQDNLPRILGCRVCAITLWKLGSPPYPSILALKSGRRIVQHVHIRR